MTVLQLLRCLRTNGGGVPGISSNSSLSLRLVDVTSMDLVRGYLSVQVIKAIRVVGVVWVRVQVITVVVVIRDLSCLL